MADKAKALVKQLRELGSLPSYVPISADTNVHSTLHEAADLIEIQDRENIAKDAEIERLRIALHEIDIEAANTIPPDGKDAAFAALFRIAQIINPFRIPNSIPRRS